tara:strand:+ start:138 stop:674 length:537 start_codon:yes stop_codon:yes gene_type:complete
LTKKLIKTSDFIKQSFGEWKSIRSTHSLAFQDFENTSSNITITDLYIKASEVLELNNKFQFKAKPKYAISIIWQANSDWIENGNSTSDKAILVFLPSDQTSGIILRNKGYAESIQSYSTYYIDDNNIFNLNTEYSSTICEEKIWFLSENVRTRYSIIKSKDNNAIIQTSHSSEIRKII